MTKKLVFLIVVHVVLICGIYCGVYFYFTRWVPSQRMRDLGWWENASQEEVRDTCHQALWFRTGSPHDAFLYLKDNGNAESVPILIGALEWQSPPDATGAADCQTWHAVDALRSLTGQEFGFEPDRWRDWWEKTGSKLPADHFHPRQRKKKQKNDSG